MGSEALLGGSSCRLTLRVAAVVAMLWLAMVAAAAVASADVVAWGRNDNGQLGNGSFSGPENCLERACSTKPVATSGLTRVASISAGGNFPFLGLEGTEFSLALESDGRVFAWGGDFRKQLGVEARECYFYEGSPYPCSPRPVSVSGLRHVTVISAGGDHSLAVLRNGKVMAWGGNGFHQLANASGLFQAPTAVAGLTDVTSVAAGSGFSLALLGNSNVMAWGDNSWGELGNGPPPSLYEGLCWDASPCRATPEPATGLSGVTAIAAGGSHSLALLSDRTVMAWGYNANGQVGDGTTAEIRNVPVPVTRLSGVIAISAGQQHSLALLRDGTVMAWGSNDYGQLGIGTTEGSAVPVPVSGLSGVAAIAAGEDYSLALLRDGTVKAWGRNLYGQLGNGTTADSDVPQPVTGLSNVTAIAAGGHHSLAYRVRRQKSSR